MKIPADAKTLFRFNNVPVKARPGFWGMIALVWAAMSILACIRRPERSWSHNLLVGALGAFVGLSADLGHALAHTVSARYAQAPMDAVLLGADMPRTLYENDDVPPRAHILRALGGPIFNAIGLSISLVWRWLSAPHTVSRELAELSSVIHGLLFLGSLAPLPMVDGGTILKWLRVKRNTD